MKHCWCQGLAKHGVSKSYCDHPHFLSHPSAWHIPKPTCPGYLWLRPNTCEGYLIRGLRVCTPFRQARCGRGCWSCLICSQGVRRDECWCLPGFCLLSFCLVLDSIPCHCAVNSQGGFLPTQANLSEPTLTDRLKCMPSLIPSTLLNSTKSIIKVIYCITLDFIIPLEPYQNFPKSVKLLALERAQIKTGHRRRCRRLGSGSFQI